MDALGRALGEGRLTMDEFDERCRQVAEAQTLGDLSPILGDLPTHTADAPSGALQPVAPSPAETQVYTAKEIVLARRQSQKKRAGAFWLGSIGAVGGAIVFGNLGVPTLSALSVLLIPTLFVLLYVMKIGPDDWYTPTIRQLERSRREAMKARQLELEASHAYEQAQRKLERKAHIDELTNEALGMAQDTVKRFRPKR